MTPNDALEKAIKAVGSQQNLADLIGLKSPSITEWKTRDRVPAERCRQIERVTKGAVTRYDLRPDVFGEQPKRRPGKREAA